MHSCGHPLEETTSILADPFNPSGEYKYVANLPVRCHACTALNLRQKEYDGDNFDSARLWSVSRVERT